MGKVLTLIVTFVLALLALSGLSQGGVPAPDDEISGPLALQIPEGLTPPDSHQPLTDWKRLGHRETALATGVDDCLTCHVPENFCNQCHGYVGGAHLVPTRTPVPTPTPRPPSAGGGVPSFAVDVLPIFAQTCAATCHNPQNAVAMGGLDLSSYQSLTTTGNQAPVIVPGNPEQSVLMQRLRGEGGQPVMPFNQPSLPVEQIDLIARWIAAGAPDN